MPRVPPPLSSFGAELQSALRKGMDAEYKITFPSKEIAIRFTQRVNQLRAAMKREKHPDWQQLYRVGLYPDPADAKVIRIAPKDSEFRKFLSDAGVDKIEEPLPIKEVEIAPSPPGTVDDFLGGIAEATSVARNLADNNTDEDKEGSEPKLGDL